MTRDELITFADHVHEHCSSCKHIKPNWGPESCKQHSCYLFQIRLMKDVFKTRPVVLEQLLTGTRRKHQDANPPTTDRMVGK